MSSASIVLLSGTSFNAFSLLHLSKGRSGATVAVLELKVHSSLHSGDSLLFRRRTWLSDHRSHLFVVASN